MVDAQSFLRGALLGSCIGVAALGLGMKAFAQPASLIDEAASISQLDAQSERALVTGGDWGTLHVTAREGQRISAGLSLGEVTRIAFEDDVVVAVRSTQSGRPGAALIEFEQEEATGDLYIVVAQGSANQIISAFVTTGSGRTYHFLFTIRDQPAAQIFVRGIGEGPILSSRQRVGREQPRTATIMEFAHRAMNAGELEAGENRMGPVELSHGVSLIDLGRLEGQGMAARIYEIRNSSSVSVPVIHQAFMTDAVVAVASRLDEVAPGTSARLAVLEYTGGEGGGR